MITTQTLLYLPTVGGRFPSARLTYETPSQLTDAIQSAVAGVWEPKENMSNAFFFRRAE